MPKKACDLERASSSASVVALATVLLFVYQAADPIGPWARALLLVLVKPDQKLEMGEVGFPDNSASSEVS